MCTYPELNRNAEIFTACLLGDRIAAVDAWKEDERRLDNTGFAFGGPHDTLSEAEAGVGHGESGRPGPVFRFDDLVAAKLDAWYKISIHLTTIWRV